MAVDFNLTQAVPTPLGGGRYDFYWGVEGAISFYGITTTEVFGALSADTVAKGIFLQGVVPDDFPVPVVALRTSNVDFAFSIGVSAPTQEGRYDFYWGNAIPLALISIYEGESFGSPLVTNFALSTTPDSILSEWGSVSPIVSVYYENNYVPDTKGFPVDFNFIQSQQELLEVDFDFTGFIGIGMGAVDDSAFGVLDVRNFLTIVTLDGVDDGVVPTGLIVESLLGKIILTGIAPPTQQIGPIAVANQNLSIKYTGFSAGAFGSPRVSFVEQPIGFSGINAGVPPHIGRIDRINNGTDTFMIMLF